MTSKTKERIRAAIEDIFDEHDGSNPKWLIDVLLETIVEAVEEANCSCDICGSRMIRVCDKCKRGRVTPNR